MRYLRDVLARHGYAAALTALCVIAVVLLAANLATAAVIVVLVTLVAALARPLVHALVGRDDRA